MELASMASTTKSLTEGPLVPFSLNGFGDWEKACAHCKVSPADPKLEDIAEGLKEYLSPLTKLKSLPRGRICQGIFSLAANKPMDPKYNPLLRWLNRELAPPLKSNHRLAPSPFPSAVSESLNALRFFACSDCTEYIGSSPQPERERVKARYALQTDDELAHEQSAKRAANENEGQFTLESLRVAAECTLAANSAVCTTFAAIAAWLLLGARTDARIEIVACPMPHVYVVVGRQGGFTDQGKLPSHEEWKEVMIVDPWIGALGCDVIYPKGTLGGIGFDKTWLQNVTPLFDSTGPVPKKAQKPGTRMNKCPQCGSDQLEQAQDWVAPTDGDRIMTIGLRCKACNYFGQRAEFDSRPIPKGKPISKET
jgi:hypothetical protein